MQKINSKLTWSFAGPWYWEFQQECEPYGGFEAKLRFLAKCGFNSMGMGFAAMDELTEDQKKWALEFMKENNITFHPVCHFEFLKVTKEEIDEYVETFKTKIVEYKDFFQCKITTSGLGASDRFDRIMPLEKKLEIYSENLKPIAKICKEFGYPLAVENHGDYYISDFIDLCKMTPDLYIFLDTGNTYLIGEKPVPAFKEAAPYVIGTHFKDHFVSPNPGNLSFDIDGAALGEGDVCLKECYEILKENAPDFDNLIMEVEFVAQKDTDPMDGMIKSIEFINSL